MLHIVTETDRPPAAAFSQCLLRRVNAGASCSADPHLNGDNNGTWWHPWWSVLLLLLLLLERSII